MSFPPKKEEKPGVEEETKKDFGDSGQTMDAFNAALDAAAVAPIPTPKKKTPEEMLMNPLDILDPEEAEENVAADPQAVLDALKVAEGGGDHHWGITMSRLASFIVTAKIQFDDGQNKGNLTVVADSENDARAEAIRRLKATWSCEENQIEILAVRKR